VLVEFRGEQATPHAIETINRVGTVGPQVVVQVRRFADQGSVQSELRKAILGRFRQEGIEIPFPTQALALDRSTVALLGQGEQQS